MRIRIELGLLLLGLRAAVILLGLGAVSLFNRMSPAIERILAENVVTLVATEEMLVALADPALSPEEAKTRFAAGLQRAKDNLTEEAEAPLIADLDRLWLRALDDPRGIIRGRVLEKLLALSEVNRRSMEEEDAAARRLGLAGAWAVVVVSLVILGMTLVLTRRLEQRVVGPLVALAERAAQIRAGDVYIRCPEAGAPELEEISRVLNQLLDLQHTPKGAQDLAKVDRRLLLHLLDQRPGAWAAVNEQGDVLACNGAALAKIQDAGPPAPETLATLRSAALSEEVTRGRLWLIPLPT
jgi:hypothetical protein